MRRSSLLLKKLYSDRWPRALSQFSLWYNEGVIDIIVKQIIHSGTCFIKRWYVERTLWFWSRISDTIHLMDRHFAVFINIKLFFTPLYGDYSFMGKLLGPLFRVWRVSAGLALYSFLCIAAAAFWTGYCLFIPYLIIKIIT